MFVGEKLVYIRHQHMSGISNKNQQPYEFANVTLSDGLESFDLNIELTKVSLFTNLKRGDSVIVTLDIGDSFGNRINFVVSDIKLAVEKHKAS